MKKQYKLGVIGGGFMAHAILKGVIYSDFLKPKKIIVADPSGEALEKLKYLGVNTTANNRDVADNCEFLLFAVKPQNFLAVADSLRGVPVEKAITIMAGVKKQKVKDLLFGIFVNLIHNQYDGLFAAAEHVGDVVVGGCKPLPSVDEEQNDLRRIYGDFGLLFYLAPHCILTLVRYPLYRPWRTRARAIRRRHKVCRA